MIDFWEAIGRLAYDRELADGLIGLLPRPKPFEVVQAVRDGYSGGGYDIPKHYYEEVQRFLEPFLGDQLLSVMAAGELIWAFSYPEIRSLFQGPLQEIIGQDGGGRHSPPPRYFTALGVILIDPRFRAAFRRAETDAMKRVRSLSDAHVESLRCILADERFCKLEVVLEREWKPGCNLDLMVSPLHLHPIALNRDRAHAAVSTTA